jgi:hypothetical protein
MQEQIEKRIDNIEKINHFVGMFIMWIFIILGAMQKSDVFYIIGITIGVARLVILIILSNIELKVHDVFWQEKLREINERDED